MKGSEHKGSGPPLIYLGWLRLTTGMRTLRKTHNLTRQQELLGYTDIRPPRVLRGRNGSPKLTMCCNERTKSHRIALE